MKSKLLKDGLYDNSISIILIKDGIRYGRYIPLSELKKDQSKLDELFIGTTHTLKELKILK